MSVISVTWMRAQDHSKWQKRMTFRIEEAKTKKGGRKKTLRFQQSL